jgi:hypothetical protein
MKEPVERAEGLLFIATVLAKKGLRTAFNETLVEESAQF